MPYIPPFIISAQAIHLIADISAQMERYAIRMEQSDALRLLKVNRIKTIHSSLAIEGNTLSEGQVCDILEGKQVVASLREIQEVKNAIATYELYPDLNPVDVCDLLKAHSTMMAALNDEAGRFRTSGVGVFGDTGLVHLAPPAERVPGLMDDLFGWLRESQDHLLIRSCVFHYEFEFIHPFSDGNGRMGRLWQSLILGRLHPLFAHLPVENMVYGSQQQYYDAIAASTAAGQSGPFIDFMLGEILKSLKAHQGEELPDILPNESPLDRQFAVIIANEFGVKFGVKFGDNEKRLLLLLNANPAMSASELAQALGITQRGAEKIIKRLRELHILERQGSVKTGMWRIIKKRTI